MPGPGVGLASFRELWLHAGTACNLSCPFCHEGSAPADVRLQPLDLATAQALIDDAVALGVERFAFTGGEPLIMRGIVDLLAYAQARRPCLVLTNGTAPLLRRPQHLARLRAGAHPLAFRVSIDHPDEARHDAGRGLKTWRRALEGLRLLHCAGFEVGVTRLQSPDEDAAAIDARFRTLLRRNGLPEAMSIVALPDLGPLRASEDDLSGGEPMPALAAPACTRSRMATMRAGSMRLLPCPLVDDDPSLELEGPLANALAARVAMRHRRCRICLTRGVDYAG